MKKNRIRGFVAGQMLWFGWLNKTIGCKSRTVPPLCAAEVFCGESQSLGNWEGKKTAENVSIGASQKTYEALSLLRSATYGAAVYLRAEKRPQHSI